MSIIAQNSLLAVQASRVAHPQRGAEAYTPRKQDDVGVYGQRQSHDRAVPGERQAPVDTVDIRVQADENRLRDVHNTQLAEQKKRTEEFATEMQVQDHERLERLSRREAPHAGHEERLRPPGSAVNISV